MTIRNDIRKNKITKYSREIKFNKKHSTTIVYYIYYIYVLHYSVTQ